MNSIYFVVPGQPIPKARPRLGRGGHAYTPDSTRNWESTVRSYAALAMAGLEPFSGRLVVAMIFRRKDRRTCDLDNLIKGVGDSMNGVVMGDDKQIIAIYASVVHGHSEPGVSVLVEEVEAKTVAKRKGKAA